MHSIAVPLSAPYDLESSPVNVFKGGVTICSLGGPFAMVHVTGTKGFFQAVFESLLCFTASWLLAPAGPPSDGRRIDNVHSRNLRVK